MEERRRVRMFSIPGEYEPTSGSITGGNINCMHDFPPELEKKEKDAISWQCSRCGMIRTYKKSNEPRTIR